MFTTIETSISDDVFTVWLNRPEVHNAFNPAMLEELAECFRDLSSVDAICVILRGKGKSFCAGADLTWMRNVTSNTYEVNYQESLLLSKCFFSIYTCSKPTIAMIHGASLGGANGLVASCDLAYCTDESTFSLSEVKIGIVPACISPYVVKRVGEYGTRDLMLTGRRIKGKEAEAFHLVNKSVPADQMETIVQEVIHHFRTSGPAAMAHGKKLIYEVSNNLSLKEAYDFTARMIADIRASEEGQEGINAFLEKRKPKWVKE
jgi:methylglutaconyl-CoA hydratase